MTEHASNGRFVRWAVALSMIAVIAVIIGVWLYMDARPQMMYSAARDAAFAGEYLQTQENLSWLEKNAPQTDYYQAVLDAAALADYNGDYDVALELIALPEGDESEAYAAFEKEAEELAALCIYHKALRLYEAGEYAQTARMAAGVRHYEPALSLYEMAQSAYQASLPTPTPSPTPPPTPDPTATPTPMPTAVPTPQEMPAVVVVTAAPTATPTPAPTPTPRPTLLPEGRVAVGWKHTVVLREDGTVAAFGDNTYGQTDVSAWKDVVYIAAGANHTLGLTAGGQVLSCGDNAHMQADVSLFGGIKAIAAGDHDSILLLHDGQVISTGYHDYAFLQEITGAQRIWAGSYGVLVQTEQGVQASHSGLALDGKLQTAAISRGYAVGVDETGALRSTTGLIPEWQNAARLSAGENAVLALTHEGEVLSHVFDEQTRCDFTFYQPVLALSAGANHYAFLLADGTLEIRYADGRVENHAY